MAKIVTLKNTSDEEVYPVTTAEAVNGGLYADNGTEVTGVVPDVTTSRIEDGAVTSDKIDWTTFIFQARMPAVASTTISTAWSPTNLGASMTVSGLDSDATYTIFAMAEYTESANTGEFRLRATGANSVEVAPYNPTGALVALPYQLQGVSPNASGQITFQRRYSGNTGNVRCGQCYITILRTA